MSEHGHLNSSQQLHLLTSCQYADKLLSEMEATLAAARSKSPFPKINPDASPEQTQAVQDFVVEMRAQLVRALEDQGVPIPPPRIGAIHSIRVILGFLHIAFDECRPRRMTGYGELAEGAETEVTVLVEGIQRTISGLSAYLAQDGNAAISPGAERQPAPGTAV